VKVVLVAVLWLAAISTAVASVVRLDEPYASARHALAAAGWKVTDYALDEDLDETPQGKQADEDLRAGYRDHDMPEVGACFPTGLGQCFAVWRKRDRLMVIELPSTDTFDRKRPPQVYFYYQTRLHRADRPTRVDWDIRSADIIPGTHPKWRRQW
jgi:hypothetical protein